MAEAAGPSIGGSETSPHMCSDRQPSRADVVLSLIDYEDLFADIDKHPEGDVRHRFLRARTKRARYVESLVFVWENKVATLEQDQKAGKEDANGEGFMNRYETAMDRLDEALSRYSRVNEEDSKAVNAPVVEPYFMDNVHRWFMEKSGRGIRAPNGTMRSTYGSFGDPVSQEYMALCDWNKDFFHTLILNKLMIPFNEHIFTPIQTSYNSLLGRNLDHHTPGMSGRTLDVLVTTSECALAVCCFAASVTLLYNLETTKTRMVAAPFASFACVAPVVFLSKDAKIIYTLMAG
ncbi:hypothetical protein K458DRAFT_405739 [Lentithecium fluviatile CBS 122367]|uniref:DUF6594 domain-containing protein n=1 Tax=Lentithecium fluviatile CBS 122367 TaxID=1168545 RepID=A0A6G1IX69_9PLEO|nr:hypothetical protein K458DRAFT_405739 [Lentithecium fluviatile CBS 122367]